MNETYNDRVVKGFLISSLVWGVAGMLAGLLAAHQLVFPVLNLDLPYTSFGRIRPLHTNAVIFGFALSIVFAGVYHSLQRLLRVRLWSDKLAMLHLVLYNITRKEKQLYVAIWFFMATVITVPILFLVNNAAIPVGLFKSYSVYSGVYDANVQWWYGHNAVAFVLTTPFLGIMYYYFPKHINQPVFSHRLSIVHFWSLIFIYIWAGPHHLLYSPLPDWAQSLGTAFSIMLILPSWGGMLNGFLTLTQAKEKIQTDATLKMFLVAITFYGMSTFEGPMMAVKSVNSLSHYTDWTIGHVHSGALGWVGFMSMAMMYYMVPRLWGRKLYSEKLANTHFWLGTLGILLYVVSMWTSGITEGAMWRAINPETGELQYQNWITISELLWPVLVGGIFEVLPPFLMAPASTVKPIAAVKPYSALELAGRDVYLKEGCMNCHSQMIRPFKWETDRFDRTHAYGDTPYSLAGEYAYDHPFLWGSKRTGPDLAHESQLQPSADWHKTHLMNPRETSPGSVMPAYPWVFKIMLDPAEVETHMRGLAKVGVPYTEDDYRKAADVKGKTEGDALIAYLLKLGRDTAHLQDGGK
ncbi:MAG: cbb3-type cytochrome c oxidase subunit I [Spirochaetia bacterium]|nr:cbb3-type cytochrome c oxidase subunit I [Spirochaetia bacterium]